MIKKFLAILTIASLSLALCATTYAQDAGPQGGRLQGRRRLARTNRKGMNPMARMQQDVLDTLDLTPDQKKQINDLNTDVDQKVATLVQQNKGTEGNKNVGAQRRILMRGYDDKLQAILTADQWRLYREGMLARMKQAREMRAKLEAQRQNNKNSDSQDSKPQPANKPPQ